MNPKLKDVFERKVVNKAHTINAARWVRGYGVRSCIITFYRGLCAFCRAVQN